MIITPELIEECKTNAGGFTNAAIIILSGERKPIKGWTRRCLGREITSKEMFAILQSNEKRNRKNEIRAAKEERELEAKWNEMSQL